MPDLDTQIHLKMLREGKRRRGLGARVRRAVHELFRKDLYGMEWGNPDQRTVLRYIREQFLLPYLGAEVTVLEIGPGGGRWTRDMTGVRKLYAVDFYEEILRELKRNFEQPNIEFIHNNGTDFPGVPEGSIDFLWSFDCFVHLDLPLIEAYLENMRPLLHARSNVVLHYSDSRKPLADRNPGFSKNDPERMRQAVRDHGYEIREEDDLTLSHSAMIRFGLPD
ncbi:MAG: class I SAM-dependent methyltransferase [Planctomycetota bacterium]